VSAAQQVPVERIMKVAVFLTLAMPDLFVINVMATGIASVNWPNQAKAYLMVAYLKASFEAMTKLSKKGLGKLFNEERRNPIALSKQLIAMQYKYAGNVQAQIDI
jgi:hypothetical protein